MITFGISHCMQKLSIDLWNAMHGAVTIDQAKSHGQCDVLSCTRIYLIYFYS